MTKKQKIWFGVFLALFIVPEVLWSPVGNFVYEIMQSGNAEGTHPFRLNFLQVSDNVNYLSAVLLIQFLGILAANILLLVIMRRMKGSWVYWTSLLTAMLLSLVSFFCFGLSVSLRNIGF